MIKTALTICGALCALTPTLACIQPPNAEEAPICEARYSSDFQGGEFDYIQYRQVYYSDRVMKNYENPYKAPRFISSYLSACSVNAGGVAIIYNDRLYDNLVPNYAPKYIGNRFSYGMQNETIDNVFANLYSLMGTTSQGTTISGFKKGMISYVEQQGYDLNLVQSTGGYYNVNIEYLKSQLEQNKLAVVFVHNFSLVTSSGLNAKDGYDSIQHKLYTGYHTMPVYGYREYNYYDVKGNLSHRDTYLCVQNCYETAAYELLNINNLCSLDDVYIIDIH